MNWIRKINFESWKKALRSERKVKGKNQKSEKKKKRRKKTHEKKTNERGEEKMRQTVEKCRVESIESIESIECREVVIQ
jgi:hypothetical protein